MISDTNRNNFDPNTFSIRQNFYAFECCQNFLSVAWL